MAGKELETDDWLPVDLSALVAVVDDKYLDRIDKLLTRATKRVNKVIESGDYDTVVKTLHEGDRQIIDAVDRS